MQGFSPGIQAVSNGAPLADGDVAGVLEAFNETQSLGFGDFMAEVCDQITDEPFLVLRVGGGGLAQVFQHSDCPFIQRGTWYPGLCCRLQFSGSGSRGWGRWLRRSRERERGKAFMTAGIDTLAQQVFDEWIETRVLGNNVEAASRIEGHGAANIVGKNEIECVPAGGSEAHQLHRCGVLEKFFDQAHIELCLPRPYQQREADSLVSDDSEVDFMNVLEINEDVV